MLLLTNAVTIKCPWTVAAHSTFAMEDGIAESEVKAIRDGRCRRTRNMAAREGLRNMLHLMFDPEGMRPFVANWPDVARSLFERVYRESIGRVVDEKTRELLAALLAYPDVNSDWKNPVAIGFMPVIPLGFIKDGRRLNYFSMVTTVGPPKPSPPRNCAWSACSQPTRRPKSIMPR
ncbi:hypothetical protein [Mesorhizobium sp. B2-3-13]|uniref:MmyB family transcriptional regulator n=1 Tax=Mesorhizobium sp. B2-3-13 TaxID=2589951 RepID=UPI001FEDC286|nr:hypothetical protein [Mesorhizobium sp. B2-3-13]